MKKWLVLLTLFFSTFILGQEKRALKGGEILLGDYPILDVHVINKNTSIGTITNAEGFFEIPLKIGDTIKFSHLNLKEKLKVITKKDIINIKQLRIRLDEKIVVLDEFTLKKTRSIFYVDKEIMTYNGPKVTARTLNLPYANTKVKKDKAIIKFRAGGVINLNNLINSLNGNNKRKRLAENMSKEDASILEIRKYYTDDFFITDLKIKAAYINPFLNYCIDKNIIPTFKKKDILHLTKLLIKESKEFPYKIENTDLYLTKN